MGPPGREEPSVGQSCTVPSWDGSPLTARAEEQQQGELQQQGAPSTHQPFRPIILSNQM